jgi:GNAT superfamily N-acetyltransferase
MLHRRRGPSLSSGPIRDLLFCVQPTDPLSNRRSHGRAPPPTRECYALVVPAAYETGYAKAGVYLQDVFVAPEARRRGVGRALLAAVAADARRRGLEFVWWASRSWNTESHAFFRTVATAEEPVIAFAAFGGKFEALADEGDRDSG